jgi:hypothetical protein
LPEHFGEFLKQMRNKPRTPNPDPHIDSLSSFSHDTNVYGNH